jgi:UDP-glucuronate 4-epimerase
MRLLITGVAGFIGFHLAKLYLKKGIVVIGIDNLNDYYDVSLKQARLQQLQEFSHFEFHYEDITNAQGVDQIFLQSQPTHVVNLAAQAGVRYSLTNAQAYIQSNIVGFSHIIECCKKYDVAHLVYASTSSVYGANSSLPYDERDNTNHPLTIYAASKKANELVAHVYSHLYQLPTTGLRFFTVYGPWGRPDMAFFSFTQNIVAGKPIEIYNFGQMIRDFTYVDDVVSGIAKALEKSPEPNPEWSSLEPDPGSSNAPYRIYNIGGGAPVALMDYISALEEALGKEAIKEFLPMQKGDVLATQASTQRLVEDFDYLPETNYKEGVNRFVKWYLDYYKVS